MLNRISLLIVVVALAATTILMFCTGPKMEVQTKPIVEEVSAAPKEAAYEPEALSRTQVEIPTRPSATEPKVVEAPPSEPEETFGWVYGNVLDIDSGLPLADARIFLDKGREGVVGFFGPFANGKSRVDGSFRMEVPAGVWRASIKLPTEKVTDRAYQGQAAGMVHGTVEVFADKETPFSFLIDTSTKLAGAIFMKDHPAQTTLRMEVIRTVDQEVVAILTLLGDHKWTQEGADDGKRSPTPNHGAFRLDYLGRYLYEIRVSPFYADAPKNGPSWSIRADLTSGSLDLGKHGVAYEDFFGPGVITVKEPTQLKPKDDSAPAAEFEWKVLGKKFND